MSDCIYEMVQNIMDPGIKLEQYHAEARDGQVCHPFDAELPCLYAQRFLLYRSTK